MFYGIPIYIIRDLYMTMRSFTKRIADYLKYQQATRNMHILYPDATIEDLTTENVCIVCREEMLPWQAIVTREERESGQQVSTTERKRPKKLPCGHVLHFQCLRSWMERQQACPICRRSVLDRPVAQANGNANPGRQQQQQGQQGGNDAARPRGHHPPAPEPGAAPDAAQGGNAGQDRPRRDRAGFFFRLGPLRVFVGRLGGGNGRLIQVERINPGGEQAGHDNHIAQEPIPNQQPTTSNQANLGQGSQPTLGGPATALNIAAQYPELARAQPAIRHHIIHTQLHAIEAYLMQEIAIANIARERMHWIRHLQNEVERARSHYINMVNNPPPPNLGAFNYRPVPPFDQNSPAGPVPVDPAALINNPYGVVNLPDGWRMFSLQPLSNAQAQLQQHSQHPQTIASSSQSSSGQPPSGQQGIPANPPPGFQHVQFPANYSPFNNIQANFAAAGAQMLQDVLAQGLNSNFPNLQRPTPTPNTTTGASGTAAATSQPQSATSTTTTTTTAFGPVTSTITINREPLTTPANGTIHPQSSSSHSAPPPPSTWPELPGALRQQLATNINQNGMNDGPSPLLPLRGNSRTSSPSPGSDTRIHSGSASASASASSAVPADVPVLQVHSPISPVEASAQQQALLESVLGSMMGVPETLGQHTGASSSNSHGTSVVGESGQSNGGLVHGSGPVAGGQSWSFGNAETTNTTNVSRHPTVEDALDEEDVD
jgi:Ring finger domain